MIAIVTSLIVVTHLSLMVAAIWIFFTGIRFATTLPSIETRLAAYGLVNSAFFVIAPFLLTNFLSTVDRLSASTELEHRTFNCTHNLHA